MKLLIVDDEPPARERLRRLLAEIEDCEVIAEAGNGEEALSRCGELRPDVVLLDVRMPEMGGLEVVRRLRASPRFHSRLLVALSGYGRGEDVQACLKAGFDRHFLTPVDPEELQQLLEAYAAGRRWVG